MVDYSDIEFEQRIYDLVGEFFADPTKYGWHADAGDMDCEAWLRRDHKIEPISAMCHTFWWLDENPWPLDEKSKLMN